MYKVILLFFLAVIFFQDIKYRAVYWFLFPLVFVACLLETKEPVSPERMWNLVFIIGMLAALTVYVSIRQGKWTNIAKGFFSWGDILFLLAISPFLPLYGFIFYFTAGTFLSLVIHLLVNAFHKQETIPYAGYMALVLSVVVLFQEKIESWV